MLGTDGRLYDSDFDFDGDGKLNAYEYSVMEASKKEIERIGNAWKQYEIDAIGTAAKFENLAKQISSINNEEKTESL